MPRRKPPLRVVAEQERVVIVRMPAERRSSTGLLVAAVICLVLGAALGVIGGELW